jgi:hypothetical protein
VARVVSFRVKGIRNPGSVPKGFKFQVIMFGFRIGFFNPNTAN